METRTANVFTKAFLSALKKPMGKIGVSPLLQQAAGAAIVAVFERANARAEGLSSDEAQARLAEFGPNIVGHELKFRRLRLLAHAIANPLVILLTLLATVSFLTGDMRAGTVMMLMVVLGLVLRFVQEARADNAAAKLKAMISVTATVLRDNKPVEIPISGIVPGDIVKLAAGDMIPGDVRLVSAKDLFIQGALTGESFPVEKFDAPDTDRNDSAAELKNICFLGTSVESGSGTAVVLATGGNTYLGSMADAIVGEQVQTSFDKGVSKFTWLMIRFMLVMVPLVFVINGFTKHNWAEAFFFAMAVAVGLTPEMLPMIVTVCLSKGAISMSHKKVIVKRLNCIQNLGAMDVLCTDKTGTLTMDRVILEKHCNVVREEYDPVLEMAFLNSHFQTGLRNVLDRAVLDHKELHHELDLAAHAKVDEIPFDFNRRMMSVVVKMPDGSNRLIAKGAPEAIFPRCTHFELENETYPAEELLIEELKEEYEQLSSDGFRVLAIAYRSVDPKAAYSKDDERDLTLVGYIAFLDPPKESARAAISRLHKHGVSVKVITGDNELVSRKICHEVGIDASHMLLGAQVEKMSDEDLAGAAETTTLFARMSPGHKQRIIRALQAKGHVLGFMGDGINDAPALRAADAGHDGVAVEHDVRQPGGDPTKQIEYQISRRAHAIFEVVAEDVQCKHVAEQVKPAAMKEHAGDERAGFAHIVVVEKAGGDHAKFHDEPLGVAIGLRQQLDEKHQHIERDQDRVDDREVLDSDCIAQRNHQIISSGTFSVGGGNARSSNVRSALVSRISRAPRFSRTWAGVPILGMATTGSCRMTQASATCAGVALCRSAMD
jgi:Mg2+-importing ATPase